MTTLYDRDELIKELKENVAEVTFRRVSDGNSRTMRCTLMSNLLPRNYQEEHLDSMHHKEENKATIVCWDIQKNGWRSFRVENVEYIEVLENY
jgi:hypothetical protein